MADTFLRSLPTCLTTTAVFLSAERNSAGQLDRRAIDQATRHRAWGTGQQGSRGAAEGQQSSSVYYGVFCLVARSRAPFKRIDEAAIITMKLFLSLLSNLLAFNKTQATPRCFLVKLERV